MQTEIIIAGFGGQGVLFCGQLLAYAGMDEGKELTWIPSYGPEMRGGTANCTVVISDEEIGSPFVHNPQAVIAMNRPSLDKYEPLVKPGGLLVINTSMTDRKAVRKDITVVEIAANDEAEKLGDQRMANMILLGALLANLPVLPQESIKKALKNHLPERHQKLLSKNFDALQEGAKYNP
jgi:2-oxoglutarate ferredoxin oxidoreductase subunit gamma